MKLYDNAISPFARKVRLVMDFKGLDYQPVDGLLKANCEDLRAVNGRVEVPVLVDGDMKVFNSADIVAYLDDRYSANSVYPADPRMRAFGRAWERCADTSLDAVIADYSIWRLMKREDKMPEGMDLAARKDLETIYDALESDLAGRQYLCGDDLSVADFALFPHIASAMSLRLSFSKERHPSITAWMRRMLQQDVFQNDLERARNYMLNIKPESVETEKIFWRGDRIEWLLSRGFHDWFQGEINHDRVTWPGIGVPTK